MRSVQLQYKKKIIPKGESLPPGFSQKTVFTTPPSAGSPRNAPFSRFSLLLSISLFLIFPFSPLSAQATNSGEGVVSLRTEALSLPEVTARSESESVPPLLQGIWQGDDRLLMFSNENEFALVLRVFYQWYDDRAAEPESFIELKSRDRNNTTTTPAENIHVSYVTICENPSKTAGVYELSVQYPHEKNPVLIPVCVIDGKIFLDFLIRDSASVTDFRISSDFPEDASSSADQNDKSAFYRSASNASAISISQPIFQKEVLSYYISESDEIYRIRYWLSEMPYSYAKATFSDGDKIFSVDKYLRIGQSVYQCTTGRSTKIRNIQKLSKFDKSATSDSDGGILAFGEPYLIKVPEGNERASVISSTAFLNTIEENNKRRSPSPKPLFPPTFPKYRWKEISELEKYNPSTWNRRNIDLHK